MRFSKTQIEGFHTNPEPDGDAWRCPYCDEPKWGETTSWFNGKPVCSELCLNSLLMVDEYETDIETAAEDLAAAKWARDIAIAIAVFLGVIVYFTWRQS